MYGIGYSLFNGITFLGSRSGVAFDPDAEAFITAYSITDETQQSAIDTAVRSFKSGNLWAKADVILPIVGGTATTHRGNLKTATNGVSWLGGITHNSDGVLFNGTTGYGDVAWSAPNTYDRTAAEWTKYYYSLNTGWSGAFDGTNVLGLQAQIVDASLQRTLGVGLNNLVGSLAYDSAWGLRASIVSANGVNGGKHYANSTLLHQDTPNATPNGVNYFVGALNNSGTAILHNNRLQQFFYFGDALTGAEVAELTTIINTFNTTLGR